MMGPYCFYTTRGCVVMAAQYSIKRKNPPLCNLLISKDLQQGLEAKFDVSTVEATTYGMFC